MALQGGGMKIFGWVLLSGALGFGLAEWALATIQLTARGSVVAYCSDGRESLTIYRGGNGKLMGDLKLAVGARSEMSCEAIIELSEHRCRKGDFAATLRPNPQGGMKVDLELSGEPDEFLY